MNEKISDPGDITERLNCTRCNRFTAFEREGKTVIKCGTCGKRHSNNSLFVVRANKRYERDEDGTLLEEPP